MILKAIIMAGGEGTRLKSVTGDTPKPMARLCGKPVLEHILALLRRSGVGRACIALRYRPEVIREYFGDGARFGLALEYHVEEAELGTAGCVRACRNFYGEEDFLVISGDCACDFDLRALMDAHLRRRPAVTMALAAHESPLQYGTVLTDRDGRVVSFIEKPAWERVVSDLVNTGIYVLSPEAMEPVPTDGTACDFARDLFPALLEAHETILGLPMDGYWCDIGTPRAYHQCNLDALYTRRPGNGTGTERGAGAGRGAALPQPGAADARAQPEPDGGGRGLQRRSGSPRAGRQRAHCPRRRPRGPVRHGTGPRPREKPCPRGKLRGPDPPAGRRHGGVTPTARQSHFPGGRVCPGPVRPKARPAPSARTATAEPFCG